jgi:thiamine-phosphate pyrophosphorylase
LLGADFITFSPVFDTPSKREYGPPQGLNALREVTRETGIPVLALGGITVARIPAVVHAGAFGVALMSGIWNSGNIEQTAFEYTRYFGGKSI